MLRAKYTAAERDRFFQMRHASPDIRIMRRFDVLWLHSCGKFVPEIAKIVRLYKVTVRKIINDYARGGEAAITKIEAYRPQSELETRRDSIVEEFERRPPTFSKEAAARIAELFGIELSSQRVRVFMKKLGFKFRKVGSIPSKANLEEQDEFKKNVKSRNRKG